MSGREKQKGIKNNEYFAWKKDKKKEETRKTEKI
jgi:hypothetical protein